MGGNWSYCGDHFTAYTKTHLKMFIYFERECEWGRGRERGRESIPSRLHAVSTEPDMRLDLTTVRSGSELKSRVRCLTD